jgi:hypothetical protein
VALADNGSGVVSWYGQAVFGQALTPGIVPLDARNLNIPQVGYPTAVAMDSNGRRWIAVTDYTVGTITSSVYVLHNP